MPILCGIATALAIVLPLAWKWQLGVRRTAVFVVATGIASGGVIALLGLKLLIPAAAGLVAAATLAISAAFLAYRFYRDPERASPSLAGAILSPADGVVVYVKRSVQGELPITSKHGRHCPLSELLKTPFYSSEAWVIGISMSLLDVHVNRAPIAGTVTFSHHYPGRFGSLRLPECVFENERATTIIQADDLQVAIVQIASRLVRQIVSYVTVGEHLTSGQRIGAIRLGSQVDVVLPLREDLHVTVRPGDEVRAGETVLGTCNKPLPISLQADGPTARTCPMPPSGAT